MFGTSIHSLRALTMPIALQATPGTDGPDVLNGTNGTDILIGRGGADVLNGNGGFDILLGGNDDDELAGGAGLDILIGGRGGDAYVVSTSDGGTDLINEKGDAPVLNGYYSSNIDTLELGQLGTLDIALHSIGVAISGDDLIISYDNAAFGTSGQVTIKGHFADTASGLEAIDFGTGVVYHISALSGDQYTYSVHSGPDAGGEDLVLGTNAGEEIYGGIGNDIMFGGGGADSFMFHDEEDANGAHDIILDFELGVDVLDFTDIKTLTEADVSVADNAWGNAKVSTAYGTIELQGVASSDVGADDFLFAL
ncbi:calcium-binding protein [Flavimaricola marinus]|uniref:Poly(Beta-D-mannuronate) C5 epimerase 6 n=1 Tax=Flavimaricola marinus TaxID=1819565 RepID=A0A238LH75_9RHOB|nr:hypothetical protein [Flavimaricola marinus]SMY08978.1 Poly(beta-D-mannuronate) C5 epimerase 6 [Flavimaricola marinus]